MAIDQPSATRSQDQRSLQLALTAAQVAEAHRGRDVVVLDLRERTPLFDYFVLATGTSGRQLRAMSDEVDRALQQDLRDRRMGIEGYQESRWVLLDYGNVVIHLFDEEMRDFYALEQLWSGVRRVPLDARLEDSA